jgi:YbbR domain-containing protein
VRFERTHLRAVWDAVRRTLLAPERIRDAFTRNLPLKLLSLLIATGLWFFVNFGERDTEQSLKVPLELRSIPAHLMITSPRVDFIDVHVSGPRTLLGRIDRNRLAIPLDLHGVRPGSAVFRIDAEALALPRGVKLMRINPAQVTLELERIARKSVPVHVQLSGKLPADLHPETKVSPEHVEVVGPASDVDDVQVANTEPIDLDGATIGTLEREVGLESPGEYITFSASRVAAQVRIEESVITREFKRVPIEVRKSARPFRLAPDQVRLTVRGPKHLIDKLELNHTAVYIDAEGADPGAHVVKPTVELPAGIALVSTDPAEVQLTILTGKPPRRGRR